MSWRKGLGVEIPDVVAVYGVVSSSQLPVLVLDEERDDETEEVDGARPGKLVSLCVCEEESGNIPDRVLEDNIGEAIVICVWSI